MARGRGRPQKQVVVQRLSSSSSKGSSSSSSHSQSNKSMAEMVISPASNPNVPIPENEIVSPRASLIQLQNQSLYSNWVESINGGISLLAAVSSRELVSVGTKPSGAAAAPIVRGSSSTQLLLGDLSSSPVEAFFKADNARPSAHISQHLKGSSSTETAVPNMSTIGSPFF